MPSLGSLEVHPFQFHTQVFVQKCIGQSTAKREVIAMDKFCKIRGHVEVTNIRQSEMHHQYSYSMFTGRLKAFKFFHSSNNISSQTSTDSEMQSKDAVKFHVGNYMVRSS